MVKSDKYIIITNSKELLRISHLSLIYVESDGNYSTLHIAGGITEIVGVQLGHLEQLIATQLKKDGNVFIRIGRSLIINRDYIYKIVPTAGRLVLCDELMNEYKLADIPHEALRKLKEIIEKGD